MAVRSDILLETTLDLKIVNGDFTQGEADAQHAQLIALSTPLSWRPVPQLGVNAIKHLKGPGGKAAFEKALRVGLKVDAYRLKQIRYNDGFNDFNIAVEQE